VSADQPSVEVSEEAAEALFRAYHADVRAEAIGTFTGKALAEAAKWPGIDMEELGRALHVAALAALQEDDRG